MFSAIRRPVVAGYVGACAVLLCCAVLLLHPRTPSARRFKTRDRDVLFLLSLQAQQQVQQQGADHHPYTHTHTHPNPSQCPPPAGPDAPLRLLLRLVP